MRLWDLTASDPATSSTVLRGHVHGITSVAISADSHWMVTGSYDKTARLWDLTASDPATSSTVLRGHESLILSVAISADSHWLATGSTDHTARLWDLTASDPATSSTVLRGHKGRIYSVAISADSHWLVTSGSGDGTARLWTLRMGELLDHARAVAGRNLSVTEWAQYFGEKPYDKTFPEYPQLK